MKEVVAVVLAGGVGKRFWPLSRAKSLVDFLGKPLIVRNLELLKSTGISKVIVVIPGTNNNFVLPQIAGLDVEIVIQKKPLGMGNALLATEKIIRERALFVLNADDVVEETFFQDIKERINKRKMFIVGKKVEHYLDVGFLKLDGERVLEIAEKPGVGNQPSNFVKLVFDFFPQSIDLFKALKSASDSRDNLYELALSKVLSEFQIELFPYKGFWQSLKYPWHVLPLMEYFLSNKLTGHRGKNIQIKDNVFIEGPVWLGDNVRIFENTKIVGPCYIGDNTVIGNNNVIRFSQIGENCVTGFNTDITRSYIGNNCWFHSNYIGDSVLEGNISMGSGTVLANLRLDEEEISSVIVGTKLPTGRNKLGAIIGSDSRIGVNTSIMPGVKIGQNSLVGAGLVIDKDIPESSFCLAKSEIKIGKNLRAVSGKDRSLFRKLI